MAADTQRAPVPDLKIRRFAELVPHYEQENTSLHKLEGVETGAKIAVGLDYYQDTEIDWKTWYEEVLICHEVFGKLEIEINGKIQRMYAGDVLYIPAGTRMKYRVTGVAAVFFAVTPVDWEKGLEAALKERANW